MDQFLRRREVAQRLRISETTLWRWARAGHFPKPHRMGPNTVGWLESQITEWVKALSTERNDAG